MTPTTAPRRGSQDINVESFSTQTEANAALLSGRADFGWADQPVADYQVKLEPGKLRISGQPCSIYPYGVAVAHKLGFDKAIEDAITYLINNGYYSQDPGRRGRHGRRGHRLGRRGQQQQPGRLDLCALVLRSPDISRSDEPGPGGRGAVRVPEASIG